MIQLFFSPAPQKADPVRNLLVRCCFPNTSPSLKLWNFWSWTKLRKHQLMELEGGLFIFLHAVSLHLTRQMKARIAVTTLPLFITPPSLLAQLRLLTLASSHPQRCKFTSSHFQVKARDRYLSYLSRWNNGNEKRTHHKRIGLDRWQP